MYVDLQDRVESLEDAVEQFRDLASDIRDKLDSLVETIERRFPNSVAGSTLKRFGNACFDPGDVKVVTPIPKKKIQIMFRDGSWLETADKKTKAAIIGYFQPAGVTHPAGESAPRNHSNGPCEPERD